MASKRRLALAVTLWVVPLLLGMVLAMMLTPLVRETSGVAPQKRTRDDANRRDSVRIQGEWEGVSLERDGRMVYQGAEARKARVFFSGDGVTFNGDGARLQGTFRLDPERRPKAFDLTMIDNGAPSTYPAGIYRLDDETFELCFAFPSRERPRSFATYPGSGRTLFIYRRVRSVQGRLTSHEESGQLVLSPDASLAVENIVD